MNPQLEQYLDMLEERNEYEDENSYQKIEVNDGKKCDAVLKGGSYLLPSENNGEINRDLPSKNILSFLPFFLAAVSVVSIGIHSLWLKATTYLLLFLNGVCNAISSRNAELLFSFGAACFISGLLVGHLLRQQEHRQRSKNPSDGKYSIGLRDDDKNTKDDLLLQYHHLLLACRSRLSALLGSIGAPLLEREPPSLVLRSDDHDDDEEDLLVGPRNCHTKILLPPQHPSHLELVEKFAKAHVELIEAIDDATHVLKIGASLQLGLGVHSKSVERVERATLHRQRREYTSGNNNAGKSADKVRRSRYCYSPPLPTFRKTVARAMNRQTNFLRTILLGQQSHCPLESSSAPSSLAEEDFVVSLSWIRSIRSEIAGLLSCIIDEWTSGASGELPDHAESQLLVALSFAVESKEHIYSSLAISSNCTPLPSGDTRPIALVNGLVSLQSHVSAVQVAIAGCLESAQNSDDGKPTDTIVTTTRDWWNRVCSVSDTLNGMLQEMDLKFFRSVKEGMDGDSSDTTATVMDVPPLPNRSNEAGHEEYSTGDNKQGQELTKTLNSNCFQNKKTLVFSGSGNVRCRRRKISKNNIPSQDRRVQDVSHQHSFLLTEGKLIQELQSHLETLALTDEIDVNNCDPEVTCASSTSLLQDNGEKPSSEDTLSPKGDDAKPSARVSTKAIPSTFLGELKESIMALPTCHPRSENSNSTSSGKS